MKEEEWEESIRGRVPTVSVKDRIRQTRSDNKTGLNSTRNKEVDNTRNPKWLLLRRMETCNRNATNSSAPPLPQTVEISPLPLLTPLSKANNLLEHRSLNLLDQRPETTASTTSSHSLEVLVRMLNTHPFRVFTLHRPPNTLVPLLPLLHLLPLCPLNLSLIQVHHQFTKPTTVFKSVHNRSQRLLIPLNDLLDLAKFLQLLLHLTTTSRKQSDLPRGMRGSQIDSWMS